MDISTRVPPAKHRVDPRQGTIDQDPEFQSFLHSLTQPKEAQSKEADNGEQLTSNNDEVKEKTVSHLVKYIQEKKIAKAKEAAAAKSAKHGRQDSQGGKPKAGEDSKKKGKETKADKNDKDKDKAAPKLLTKKAAAQEAAAEAAKQAAGQASATKNSEEAAPKSRRANIAQAAKILQRDLGLSPGSAHRRARQNAAKAETGPGTESVTSTTAEKQPLAVKEPETSKSVPTGPKAQANEGSRRSRGKAKATGSTAATESNKGKSNDGPTKPTTGPIILLKKEASKKEESGATAPASTQSTGNTASTAASAAPITPTGPKASGSKGASSKVGLSGQQKKGAAQTGSGALRAFVKHANPSQGITEVLLKQAMGAFGPVTFIEMDKRKGFAYVDFADTEALRKAIAASPVSIAQGTVQVLERKEKSAGDAQGTAASTSTSAAASASTSTDRPKRGNRGRGRRGGGAGANPTTITNGNNETPSSAGPATG